MQLIGLVVFAALAASAAGAACPKGCECQYDKQGECKAQINCPCGTVLTGVSDKDCVFFSRTASFPPAHGWLSAIPSSAKRVDLYGCGISTIPPGTFSHLAQTRVMNLEYNALKKIEDGAFKGMTNLKVLWLTGHHLRADDTAAEEYKAVAPRANAIESVGEGAFSDQRNLVVLLMHHNKFASLPDGVFKAPSKTLRVLKLLDNPVKLTAGAGPLAGLGDVKQLDISDDSGDFLEDWMEQKGHYIDDNNGDESQWWDPNSAFRKENKEGGGEADDDDGAGGDGEDGADDGADGADGKQDL